MGKPKSKKKPIPKRPQPVPKKSSTAVGGKGDAPAKTSSAAKKSKAASTASAASVGPTNSPKKSKPPAKANDCKELVVRKRMASLNASAMLAAAYEVERHLDRVESMATSENDAPKPALSKKIKDIKDIKDEVLESKDVTNTHNPRPNPHGPISKPKIVFFFPFFLSMVSTGKARFHKCGYRSRHRRHHYRRLCELDARLEPGSLL